MPAWSLILFTLVVQACVGAMVWIELLRLPVPGRKRAGLPDKIHATTMMGITVGVGAAALLSLMHLGSPIKAVFVLDNLGTSWLSREIFLVILFGGGVALATVMRRQRWGSETSLMFINRISALLGLVLIYVMARVYMLPTTPSWNMAATVISFYATSLVLGGSAVLTGVMYSGGESSSAKTARVVLWALMICLGVEIVLTPFQAGVLYQHPLVVDQGDRFGALNLLLGMRVLNVAVALGFLIKLRSVSTQRPGPWLLFTIGLVLSAETLGRYIFYAFYYRIGV